jgi:transposase InsO family protein
MDTLWEAEVLCGNWIKLYNTARPHSALGYLPPVPEAYLRLWELAFLT